MRQLSRNSLWNKPFNCRHRIWKLWEKHILRSEKLHTILIHRLKRLDAYTKRFNTITQYLGRGTLDEQTAAVMKALAKRKLEKALQDNNYAQGSYAAEMEQTALLAEARVNTKQ